MQCPKCGEVKLSSEFPLRAALACSRPSLWCLDCTLAWIRLVNKCPECAAVITQADKDSLGARRAELAQEELFEVVVPPPPLSAATSPKNSSLFSPKPKSAAPTFTHGTIRVSLLDGSSCVVHISPTTTVEQVQRTVARNLKTPATHQKLIFEGTAIKAVGPTGKIMTMQDYGVQDGSKLLCLRLLFTINRTLGLDRVVFNLIWGYPRRGRDFLDGSCLVYEHGVFLFPINFGNRRNYVTGDALFHSGDMMGDHSGRHRIDLSLKSLPKNITHLFFTLSSFSGNRLSDFRLPSVMLCRQESPDPLLEYSLQHAGTGQALIMCCLVRDAADASEWSVVALGKPADGNVGNYAPIIRVIDSMFIDGMFKFASNS